MMHILLHVTEPDFRRLVEAGDIAVPTTAAKQTSKRLVASRSTDQSQASALWTAQDLDRVWAAKQAWRVSDRRYCATALELAEMRNNTLVPRAFDWRRDASRPQNFGEFARHTLDMKHRSPRALLNAGLRVDHERRAKVRSVQKPRSTSSKERANAKEQVDCAHSKRHSWRSSSQYLQQRRLQQQSDTVQNVPINGNKRTFDSITMSVDGTSDGTDSSQGTSETTTAKQSNSSAGKSTTSSSSGSNSVDDDAEWNEWLADKDWWLAVGGQRKRRRFEPDSAEKKPVVKTQQRRHKRDDTLERVFERICASAAQKVTQVNTPV